ncbi:hypothetical protein BN439_3525 [Erwinia amylovora Ea644]|nr:hypothetical protein BN439_3525 [Erwinia amylovora Ea644]
MIQANASSQRICSLEYVGYEGMCYIGLSEGGHTRSGEVLPGTGSPPSPPEHLADLPLARVFPMPLMR